MSTQSSISTSTTFVNDLQLDSSKWQGRMRVCSLSNSELTRAADEAFSKTTRQDKGLEDIDDLARSENPLGCCLRLRKRKCNIFPPSTPGGSAQSANVDISADFLSGIFQDIADAASDTGAKGSEPDGHCYVNLHAPNSALASSPTSHLIHSNTMNVRPSKKARTFGRSLSRCSKSFANLDQGSLNDQAENFLATHALNSNTPNTTTITSSFATPCTSTTNILAHPVSANSTAAQIVDHVFSNSLTNLNFPSLPATVSASSCSSNMLTQTSMQAAQVETHSNLNTFLGGSEHEHKDVYGWFVEMDEEALQDRFQAVEVASENCKAIANPDLQESLTFAAAPTEQDQVKRSVELDSEVEWAKAADTVDDVLGEIPFF